MESRIDTEVGLRTDMIFYRLSVLNFGGNSRMMLKHRSHHAIPLSKVVLKMTTCGLSGAMDEEIYQAVNQINLLKALGSDGMHNTLTYKTFRGENNF